MTSIKKKLISLNLVLLLLALYTIPVYAASRSEMQSIQDSNYSTEAISSEYDGIERLELKAKNPDELKNVESNLLNQVPLLSSSSDSYYISVDGTTFKSDTDTSGSTWSYKADNNSLTLNGYRGSGIRASGDLVIYSKGTVTVTGSNGTNYGSDAIEVGGALDICVQDGSLTVTAGSGSTQGGDAVSVSGALSCSCYSGTANFTGGKTTASSTSSGGDALSCASVYIFGSGITATGGTGNSTSTYKGSGGCGIISSSIYIYADCTLQGGGGYYGGPAIYFGSYCSFGIVNANVRGGSGLNGYAIQNSNGLSWYYNGQHTTISGSSYAVYIKINQYTLNLLGNGGTYYNGATYTSLKAYYPTSYYLAGYCFQRKGYTQVGWSTTALAGNLMQLNTFYLPTTNGSLYSYWEATEENDILLNGLSGNLSNGTFYKKYSNTPVILPSQLTYDNNSLLAWCTTVTASPLNLKIYAGQWYAGGDTIIPDSKTVTLLYAQAQGGGQYAIYHPTQGTINNGGTIIVQGTTSTDSDLQVYTPGGTYFSAPEGYELAGWSKTPNSTTVDYAPGSTLPLYRGTTIHLYALWKPIEYDYVPETGLTITLIPATKTVRITMTANWCSLYSQKFGLCGLYEDGKMLNCSMAALQSGQTQELEMQYTGETPPVCKVFALDTSYKPICHCTTCNLSSLS